MAWIPYLEKEPDTFMRIGHFDQLQGHMLLPTTMPSGQIVQLKENFMMLIQLVTAINNDLKTATYIPSIMPTYFVDPFQ